MTMQNIQSPISTKDFLNKFSTKFQNWGNCITKELIDTWEQNCLVFNNAIYKKEDKLKFVVSAPTGTAKTENTITYCSMLPKNITVLISTNLTEEADRLAKDINNEANELRACSFHSKKQLPLKEATTFQIVIITHAFYKNNFTGTEKWIQLSENRDLVIIDEALSTMNEYSLEVKELLRLKSFMEMLSFWNIHSFDGSKYNLGNELTKLESDIKQMRNHFMHIHEVGNNLLRSDTLVNISDDEQKLLIKNIKIPRYDLILKILKKNSFEFSKLLIDSKDDFNDKKIRENFIQTVHKLNDFHQRQVYVTITNNEFSYNRVVDSTPDHTLICFDATADVNSTYKLRELYHKDLILLPKIKNVRDYSTVNLHYAVTRTGKNTIEENLVEDVFNSITFGKKTLVITHKLNKEYFVTCLNDKYPNEYVEVAHWGAITGLNNWNDFDTCVIIGLNQKSNQYYQNRTLINTNESTAFGKDQNEINQDLKITDMVAEIIQAMNRIHIRKVSNSKGQCEPADIYLTLPKQDTGKYLNLIENQMSNIQINLWHLNDSSSSRKQTTTDTIIKYLLQNLDVGSKVEIKKVQSEEGINKETYRDLIRKSKFNSTLTRNHIEIIEIFEKDKKGRSRKTPTKYFHRVK